MTPREKAELLIRSVRDALAHGTKHYSVKDGRPLTSAQEILEAMVKEGGVSFEPKEKE